MMRNELKQADGLLRLIASASEILRRPEGYGEALCRDILDGIACVNGALFGKAALPCAPVTENFMDQNIFLEQVERWLAFMGKELEIREHITVDIDYGFYCLTQYVRMSSQEELVQGAVQALEKIREANEGKYLLIRNFHNGLFHLWGKIDLDEGVYELFEERARELKEHLEEFEWLYQELEDYRSKKVLYGILHFWLTLDYEAKKTLTENNFQPYYDCDIFTCDENEVLVDLGAYVGDSVLSYISTYGIYKKIHCYEMTPDTARTLKQNLQGYEGIEIHNAGVGSENKVMYMRSDKCTSCNYLTDEGYPVEVVTLDEDISEPITFLKMDIEGSEPEALEGARRHICEDQPKLAISAYHKNRHLWEIPRKIREMNPDYKLYMRYYDEQNGIGATEYSVLAKVERER